MWEAGSVRGTETSKELQRAKHAHLHAFEGESDLPFSESMEGTAGF